MDDPKSSFNSRNKQRTLQPKYTYTARLGVIFSCIALFRTNNREIFIYSFAKSSQWKCRPLSMMARICQCVTTRMHSIVRSRTLLVCLSAACMANFLRIDSWSPH